VYERAQREGVGKWLREILQTSRKEECTGGVRLKKPTSQKENNLPII